MNKSYAEMTAEVHENNVNKGWYNDERTYQEALGLLHSEISEALEAYRQWGMEDQTGWNLAEAERFHVNFLPKPEGVASELADVLIRMLDDAKRANVNLDVAMVTQYGRYAIEDRFGMVVDTMHNFVSSISRAYCDTWDEAYNAAIGRAYANLLTYLLQVCAHFGIDLDAEYERKMRYNRTRSYRHGGKLL